MLTLRLLGGLSLEDSERPVPTRATQRRRLALLVILAMAGERTTSKDKLIALLWPDADREHARHLLSDSLYVLREALGAGLFRVTGEFVALDPAHIDSDVAQFRRALAAGDPLRAVQINGAHGPFLDGVHLADLTEFERWVDGERARLATELQGALECLARDAESRRDFPRAVEWRRRLAAESPYSSSAAVALMRALADSGDTPGALAYGRVHSSLVKAEFECAPDAQVIALIVELHAREGMSTRARGAVATPLPALSVATGDAESPGAEHPAPAEESLSSAAATVRLPWRNPFVIGSAALVALSAVVLAFRITGEPPARHTAAVAVVSFRGATGRADDAALAAGVTENLAHVLAGSLGSPVITTAHPIGTAEPRQLRRLGESLHVTQLVDGEVRRDGSRVGVTVRLIDVATGYPQWTGSFIHGTQDILHLQDDVGHAVIAAARVPRRGDVGATRARQGTTSLTAYDLYLRGRHQEGLRSDTGFRAAVELYRAAIAADSSFPAAWAGLAESYALTSVANDYERFPPRETARKAEQAALRAIALDDSLGEAHFALALVRMVGPIDFAESERELKRALALDPTDPRNHGYLSILYAWTDRPDAAVREARVVVDADPLSVTALRDLGHALLVARRYDEALAQLDRARTIGDPVRVAYQMKGQIYALRGMYPEAIDALRQRYELLTQAMLAHTLARSGDASAARLRLDDLTRRWRAGTGGAFEVAVVYAGLKDYDRTFEWLARAMDDHSICGTIMEPMFDDVRADPRFGPIRRRLMGRG